MRSSLTSFIRGLNDLRDYIKTLELEADLLSADIDKTTTVPSEILLLILREHVSKSGNKKRFDYNSIVVSLYGYFEQFIESLLRDHISYLNTVIPKYDDLPESIIKNHLDLSFALVKRGEQTRYKGMINSSQIISNLHSCMGNVGRYQINAEAFTYHSANFRSDVIDECFSKLGILSISRKVIEGSIFTEYLRQANPDRDITRMKPEDAYYYMNDLAERRNEVAHGSSSDTLSNDILLEYVKFFENYGTALYQVIREEALPFEVRYQSLPLGNPIAVYDNKIVCVYIQDMAIKVGDTLIAETPKNRYVSGDIQEIQVEHVSYQEVNASSKIAIGMRVNFKAKSNHKFYLMVK